VKTALNLYRVLATVVGISIIILVLVALPLNELHRVNPAWFPVGSTAQTIGDHINMVLGTAHGFIYMVFLLVAFVLSRMARWSIAFTVVTLVCGTIPFLSFWAEVRAIRQVEGVLGSQDPAPSVTQRPS
jgi:integral membrane protein